MKITIDESPGYWTVEWEDGVRQIFTSRDELLEQVFKVDSEAEYDEAYQNGYEDGHRDAKEDSEEEIKNVVSDIILRLEEMLQSLKEEYR